MSLRHFGKTTIAAVILAVTWMSAAAAATSAQTVGIPGTASVAPGQRILYSDGSRMLSVENVATSSTELLTTFDGATLTLKATANYTVTVAPPLRCQSVDGLPWALSCQDPPQSVAVRVDGPSRGGLCYSATLPTGWNLVSGQQAQAFTSNSGPAFTLGPDGASYSAVSLPARLQAAGGYWVYFDMPTEVFLGGCGPPADSSPEPVSIGLPAGQWVMIGNPFNGSADNSAIVEGADSVFTYSADGGYQRSSTLQIGQGAFVFSASGATVTIVPN